MIADVELSILLKWLVLICRHALACVCVCVRACVLYCPHQIKDSVMRRALRAKFTQHSELRELLLSTGNCRLVEHTANDHYWADGGDGSGMNRLGELLMSVRGHTQLQQLKHFVWYCSILREAAVGTYAAVGTHAAVRTHATHSNCIIAAATLFPLCSCLAVST